MTIEELKALTAASEDGEIHESVMLGQALGRLAPEILALVEACQHHREYEFGGYEPARGIIEALDAFNAKLEAL